jgi:hypothetical protein
VGGRSGRKQGIEGQQVVRSCSICYTTEGAFEAGRGCRSGGDDRSAVLYTVIESRGRRGLDPYAYLKDVLTRLPAMTNHQVLEITPAH